MVLSAAEDLAAGMLAGIASRFFTTPLSNVTVRLQTSSTAKEKREEDAKGKGKQVEKAVHESDSDDEGEYNDAPGIVDTLRQIVKEKGIGGACVCGGRLCMLHADTARLLQGSGRATRRRSCSRSRRR